MMTKAEKKIERARLKALSKVPMKTEMFTIRLTPDQVRYLDYASTELAALMGRSPKEISKGYIMLKMMEFGRAGFERFVATLQEPSEAG